MQTRRRPLSLLFTLIGLAYLTIPLFGEPPSQSYSPPITSWGHPDLEGIWNNSTNVPLERPDALTGRATITDAEIADRRQKLSETTFGTNENRIDAGGTGFYNQIWNEDGIDGNRTSLIVTPSNGKLPELTAEGQQDRALGAPYVQRRPVDIGDLTVYERCITRGLPGAMMPGFYNHNYQILQTPHYVAIIVEMIHDVRIIPLDARPHLSPMIRQWLGNSRGHWEGNTLIIETTHFPKTVSQRGLVRPHDFHLHGTKLKIVERFTRLSDDTIDYRFTVDDPRTFTDTWTAAIPLNRFDGSIFEYACHEGNYAMENMLSGARADDRRRRDGLPVSSDGIK